MNRRLLAALLVIGIAGIAGIAAPLQAQTADEKELQSYKLTIENVRKMTAVMRTLMKQAADEPKAKELAKVREEIAAIEKKTDLTEAEDKKLEQLREQAAELENQIDRDSGRGNANTIDEMEAQVKSQPGAVKALAAEGLAPREFAKTFLALFQAGMVRGFTQGGDVDLSKLPPGVNPENIKFVKEHEKELVALQQELQGPVKKGGG